MSIIDPVTEALMAKGAPFEVVTETVQGKSLKVFKGAPETLTDIIDQARNYGSAEFIVSARRRITYDQFFAAADYFASLLVHKEHVTPGQSIAICMKNSPEWMVCFVGILRAGCVAVLVNSRGTMKTMRDAIVDTDSVLVLTDRRRHEMLSKAGFPVPLKLIGKIGSGALKGPLPELNRSADDIAAMFFTSGTTGRAKAAAMSNRALVTGTMNTQMAMTAVFQKLATTHNTDVETLKSQLPQSSSILIFPLFHTSGCSAVFLTTLVNGGKLVLMDRWNAEKAIELMEKERVTVFGGVPAIHWDVLKSDALDQYDLSSLISISSGGQAFPLNLMTALQERFPKTFIGAGYGMTETSGQVSQAVGAALLKKPQASGKILPMMDVRISRDDGEELEAGIAGEIWVKGATVMTEYYGRPEDTKAAFVGEWFKTGDVGFVDDDNYIHIVDRKTDMIISGGENIYCVEVEAAINKHPDVLQICTFGVPDDRLGERLIACYVSSTGDLTSDELQLFTAEHLPAYRMPTEFISVKTPFVLNAMSKIEKRKVRARFIAGHYRADDSEAF